LLFVICYTTKEQRRASGAIMTQAKDQEEINSWKDIPEFETEEEEPE